MLKPDKTDFMDADMLALWKKMKPEDLPGYRLYGGTALALYLDHRKSTDFDFFREGPVSRNDLTKIPWLKNVRFDGENRMVDAFVKGTERVVKFNFISIEDFHVIPPKHPPTRGQNNIEVAHPTDILANKLAALTDRKAYRDYFDIAYASTTIPDCLNEAIPIYLQDKMTADSRPGELAKSINNYTYEIEYSLPKSLLDEINKLTKRLSRAKDINALEEQTRDHHEL